MLERADLRAIRNMMVHRDSELPRRILRAWQLGAQDTLVAKATVLKDRLLVMSCSAKQFEVGFDEMPALARIPQTERADFRIAEDGSYVHWPAADVHIDIDAIRSWLEPEWRDRMAAKDTSYGAAIRVLRQEAGLSQSAIEGLSERQVRRIELGESLSSDSLQRFATALGMTLSDFLSKAAEVAAGGGSREPKKGGA